MEALIIPTILTFHFTVLEEEMDGFYEWQAKLNRIVASFTGFISLETALALNSSLDWVIALRFQTVADLENWKFSSIYQELFFELKKYTIKNSIECDESTASNARVGVTEVFVTQVSPENEEAFRNWSAKIHQLEARFPGFRGTYLQSPTAGQGSHWITLLQFDTPEHLDQWLCSKERAEILKESEPLITSLEGHRMVSSYAGWFGSSDSQKIVPGWKQSMLVILVLYPIVMFEMIFFSPFMKYLTTPIHTFIGNVISVSLITFPFMPFVLRYLGWWLTPVAENHTPNTFKGLFIIIGLYLLEILFFNFLRVE